MNYYRKGGSQMVEPFDYWAKAMEKVWKPWQQPASAFPWMPSPEMPLQGRLAAWVGAMRSTYEVHMSWWQTFTGQSEELFLKMFKDSPMYNAEVEEQLRNAWQKLGELQVQQRENIREQFVRMEALLKEQEKAE